ncbi:DUF881 domain-containing protein [Fodinisporobacter ferrooxydans]|uniref:DUF881 domain-containing protein n=1 Tax=Fodinisporobacter ferrooxydans TaxID=2901836 RepID=A0ABY4CMT1_9BACL|nr:DUF881 domain-containing protein [Alicyclobacillaceae bacterium MYW30-H2]
MNVQNRLIVSLTFISVILGTMVALQYRTIHNSPARTFLEQMDGNTKQLQAELNALHQFNSKQEKHLNSLNQQLSQYEKQTAEGSSAMKTIQNELNEAKILSGSIPVHGPGIILTINDSQKAPEKGANIELSLTHDWDVRSVINELFTAGAEAISVNGVRIVSTSGVFCIGPVIKVNDVRLVPPFDIDAIGNPNTLATALNIRGGILDYLRSRGLEITAPKQEQDIHIKAFTAGPVDNGSSGNGS